MLLWNLEKWLTKEGAKIVHKAAQDGQTSLNEKERLVYEIWLFDTEQCNGGVSQYFCNRGLHQWDLLSNIATPILPSFAPFAILINRVIGRSPDPYQEIIDSDIDLDAHYNEYKIRLLTELKALTV